MELYLSLTLTVCVCVCTKKGERNILIVMLCYMMSHSSSHSFNYFMYCRILWIVVQSTDITLMSNALTHNHILEKKAFNLSKNMKFFECSLYEQHVANIKTCIMVLILCLARVSCQPMHICTLQFLLFLTLFFVLFNKFTF